MCAFDKIKLTKLPFLLSSQLSGVKSTKCNAEDISSGIVNT